MYSFILVHNYKNIIIIIMTMQAIIFQPCKNAMQSAPIKDNKWLLRCDVVVSSKNNLLNHGNNFIQLSFSSKDAAIKYAQSQGLLFDVLEVQTSKIIKKQYNPSSN